jgi:hypothetical protein
MFPLIFSLGYLNSPKGITLNGAVNGQFKDYSGAAVSNIGDVNDDGIDDVIISAYNKMGKGGSYVVFGTRNNFSSPVNLANLNGTNGFIVNGTALDDRAGTSVNGEGDINGDGIDDIIIGAPAANNNIGQCYIIFGKKNGFVSPFALSSLNGINGFIVNGIGSNNYLGRSVSISGDFNGDGINDIIIGASEVNNAAGQSYLIFGKSSGFNNLFALSSLNGNNGFIIDGIKPSDRSGASVNIGKDFNGDGIDDIIIGAPFANNEAGQCYVLFGRSGSFTSPFALSSLNGNNGFTINGIKPRDYSGGWVNIKGDFNGDGINDMLIGTAGAGKNYIVFGNTNNDFSSHFNLTNLNGTNGFATNEITGAPTSLNIAGDINGDGIDDIIIGASSLNGARGMSYVIYGSRNGFITPFNFANINGYNGFLIEGAQPSDSSGISVSRAGDFNGDGLDDIIIGAFNANNGAGQSYIIYGNNLPLPSPSPTLSPTPSITASPSATSLSSVSSSPTPSPNNNLPFPSVINLNNLHVLSGFKINGFNTGGKSGSVVSGAGDINNDGLDDVIICDTSNGLAGQCNVIYGSKAKFASTFNLGSLNGQNGFRIHGDTNYVGFGSAVASVGDFNGDGIDDIIIGQSQTELLPGSSYIIFGKNQAFSHPFRTPTLNGQNGFAIYGAFNGNRVGMAVSGVKDMNGDGIADVILGTPYPPSPLHSTIYSGGSYVLFGSRNSFQPSINVGNLNGRNGFSIGYFDDKAGTSVSGIGDINGDGLGDVIINSLFLNEMYVVFGSNSGFDNPFRMTGLNGQNGFKIVGASPYAVGGIAKGIGDFNGDGIADVAFTGGDIAPMRPGYVYILLGQRSEFSNPVTPHLLGWPAGLIIRGMNYADGIGTSISGLGDINGDGIDDIIIGAPYANNNVGQSYVIFGSRTAFDIYNWNTPFDLRSLNGQNGFVINGINSPDYCGATVASAGDINGDSINDILIGAPYANNEIGQSYIIYGRGNVSSSTNTNFAPANSDVKGAVIGGVVGGILGIAAIAFGSCFIYKMTHKTPLTSGESNLARIAATTVAASIELVTQTNPLAIADKTLAENGHTDLTTTGHVEWN